MTVASALLVDLTRRGIELAPAGDRLRYRPRSAMTPELAKQVRAHKAELLAILDRGVADCGEDDPEIPPRPLGRPGHVTELVLRNGHWWWRRRRMDDADRAWAAYHAAQLRS